MEGKYTPITVKVEALIKWLSAECSIKDIFQKNMFSFVGTVKQINALYLV